MHYTAQSGHHPIEPSTVHWKARKFQKGLQPRLINVSELRNDALNNKHALYGT